MERILSLEDLYIKLRLDEYQLHDLMISDLHTIKSFIELNGHKVSRRTVIEMRDFYWYDQPEYEAIKEQILLLHFDRYTFKEQVHTKILLMQAKIKDWWRWVAFN